MFQHKRLINGEEYKPAGGGSHRGYDLRCERIEYFPYRISVLHLLPRYAPRTENPPAGVSTVARSFSLMTVERYPLWQVYFTTPTRLRYRSTALTACVALSSSTFTVTLV